MQTFETFITRSHSGTWRRMHSRISSDKSDIPTEDEDIVSSSRTAWGEKKQMVSQLLKCLCIRSTFGRSYQDGQDAMSLIFYLYPIEILDIYSCWGPTFRSFPFNVSECIRRLYAMLLLQQQKCAGFVKNFFLFNRFAVWSIMWQETVNYASQDEFLKCLVLYSVYFQSGVRTSETICI